MKKIDIIIPSFNDIRIVKTIKSVRNADDCNCARIIVIDGGSTQEVLTQISKYLFQNDILISEPDHGIFDALNKGLDTSKSEYIGWLGSDDYYSKDFKISKLLEELSEKDIVIYDTTHIKSGVVRRKTYARMTNAFTVKLGFNNPHYSTFLNRRTIGTNRFKTTLKSSDIEFFLRIFSQNSRVLKVNEVSTFMELGGYSTRSATAILERAYELWSVYRAHTLMWPFSPVIKIAYKSVTSIIMRLDKRLAD